MKKELGDQVFTTHGFDIKIRIKRAAHKVQVQLLSAPKVQGKCSFCIFIVFISVFVLNRHQGFRPDNRSERVKKHKAKTPGDYLCSRAQWDVPSPQ